MVMDILSGQKTITVAALWLFRERCTSQVFLCSDGVKWFQTKDQFQDGSYVPAAGDIIFFDWKNDGTIDHVGIVENVADGMVHTVEGNSME